MLRHGNHCYSMRCYLLLYDNNTDINTATVTKNNHRNTDQLQRQKSQKIDNNTEINTTTDTVNNHRNT